MRQSPVFCKSCQAPNPVGAELCRSCGEKLSPGETTELPAELDRTVPIAKPPERTRRPLKPAPVDFKPAVSYLDEQENPPVMVSLWFSGVLVGGSMSQIWAKVQNRTGQLIQQVELALESSGLDRPLVEKITQIDPNQIVPVLFDNVLPTSPGVFALQVSLEYRILKQRERLAGARTLWVNARPEGAAATGGIRTDRFATNSDAGKIPDGSATSALLSEAKGSFQLESQNRTVEDLLKFRLEEIYQPLSLSFPPSIPESSRGSVAPGVVLKLTPDIAEAPAFHLVARRQFRIGRARHESSAAESSDLVIWYLPRNPENDKKTKRLGRQQVLVERTDTGIIFRNAKQEHQTFLDQIALGADAVPFEAREGSLAVVDYNLDILRFPALEGARLTIRNLEAWKGKPDKEPPFQGAFAFRPVGRRLPFHDAIWILSSASFGADPKRSALVLPELAPVQGCFYHRHGCFWLQNLVRNNKVLMNGQPALPDQIFPLCADDRLTIGGNEYGVQVSAE